MGVALLDSQGHIIRCNNALNKSFKQCKQPRPTKLSEIIDSKQRDALHAYMDIVRQPGHTPKEPFSAQLDSDDDVSVAISIGKIDGSQGPSDPSYYAFIMDTTEQTSLEAKYAHSQKMQAVGQLAGGIAHDFNNLLTAMIGFCDLLLMRHPAGDQSFADIMQIKQNANRAANLVRQLLAFSRRQTLQPKTVNVTDLLAEITDLIRRLIGENIELNMQHGRDLGMVKVDQGQFEQVIINLAVNARDAMNEGGTLSIRTSNRVIDQKNPMERNLIQPADDDAIAHGEYVVIEIADTGTGIPRNIIDKIFEPFFSTKAVGSGTGLGLATVFGIVKQTGGHILVESTPAKGTRFVILFKRYVEDATKPLPQHEEEHAEQPAKEERATDLTGKGTILLVEDEAPVRIFSSRALNKKGYNVIEADNGESGLAILMEQGDEIDLVVSDVIMPGLDGPSMIQQAAEKLPNLRIIFMSGYAEDALGKMDDQPIEYGFLQKPFTLKQLAQKVKDALSNSDDQPQRQSA